MTSQRKAISGFYQQLLAQLLVLLLLCLPAISSLHAVRERASPCIESSKPCLYVGQEDCAICDFLAHSQSMHFLLPAFGPLTAMLVTGRVFYGSFVASGPAAALGEHANKGPPSALGPGAPAHRIEIPLTVKGNRHRVMPNTLKNICKLKHPNAIHHGNN